MVVIKTNKAEGSFLGLGTHTWLELTCSDGKVVTYSGSKGSKGILLVIKNFKRDLERAADHGVIEIAAPDGLTEDEWTEKVMASAENVKAEMHQAYAFCGVFPWGMSLKKKHGERIPRANCCIVLQRIIAEAGGEIPRVKVKGFTPGLWT